MKPTFTELELAFGNVTLHWNNARDFFIAGNDDSAADAYEAAAESFNEVAHIASDLANMATEAALGCHADAIADY